MTKKSLIIIGVLSLILLALPLVLQASPIGKCTFVQGRADILSPAQESRMAILGGPVSVGDIIRTKSSAKIEITFMDGNILRLAQNSRLRITEYMISPQKTSGIMNLFRGKVHSIVKRAVSETKAGRGMRYEVHTPMAVCGVRGTDFVTYHENNTSGSIFREGSGYFYSKNRPQDVKNVTVDQAAVTSSADKPPVIRPSSASELDQHIIETDPLEGQTPTKPQDTSSGLPTGEYVPTDTANGDTPLPPPESLPPPPPQATQGTPFNGNVKAESPFIGIPTTTTPPIQGILTGNVDPATNQGTADVTGTYTQEILPDLWGGSVTGMTEDGTSFAGYYMGATGSPWKGLISTIYATGTGAGYFYGVQDGTETSQAFTGSGQVKRTGILGDTDIDPDQLMATLETSHWSRPVPIIGSVNIGGVADPFDTDLATGDIVGLTLTSGRQLGVWGVTTEGGTYSNTSGLTSWSGIFGQYGQYIGTQQSYDYYMIGDIAGTDDDLAGHAKIAANITYIDPEYLGNIGLDYRGIYDNLTEGPNYKSVGAGTFTLDPLAFSGTWGNIPAACLWHNNNGNMTPPEAGYERGLLGGLSNFWSAPVEFNAIGEYHYDPAVAPDQPHYLWNSQIQGYDTSFTSFDSAYNNGAGSAYFTGFTGGIWKKVSDFYGTMDGFGNALFLSKINDSNQVTAGYLTIEPSSTGAFMGYYYIGAGMWQAQGILTATNVVTYLMSASDTITMGNGYLMADRLAGQFANNTGSIYGKGFTGQTTYFLKNGSSLNWGIYDLKLGEGNTYASKPAGDAAWSARVGGRGQFSSGENSEGYWIGTINSTDSSWTDSGEINASVTANYLTPKKKGSLGGPYKGINNGNNGTWIGESIGTFSGEPMLFSAKTDAGNFGYWIPPTTSPANIGWAGSFEGVIGKTAAFSPAGTAFVGMGKYDDGGHRFFAASMDGLNMPSVNATSKLGFFGMRLNNTTLTNNLKGKIIGLYYKPTGAANTYELGTINSDAITTAPVTGSFYTDIKMWEANGSLASQSKTTITSTSTPIITYNVTEIKGSLGGKLPGGLLGSMAYIEGQPWGFIYAGIGGTWEEETFPSEFPYTFKAGGTADTGYWLTDIKINSTDTTTTPNTFYGTLANGKFMSSDVLGQYSGGDVFATYGSPYEGVLLAPYESQTLCFSSIIDDKLYQLVPGGFYFDDYQKEHYFGTGNGFQNLNYEAMYFSVDGQTAAGFQSESFDQVEGNNAYRESWVYTDSIYFGKSYGKGITGQVFERGPSSNLSEFPNLAALPTPTGNFPGVVSTDPFSADEYINTSPKQNFTDINALVQAADFQGIMGGLPGTSLWLSNSGSPTSLKFMGSHGNYTGAVLFNAGMFSQKPDSLVYTTPDGGAYLTFISGRDLGAAANGDLLDGVNYGLYENPDGSEAGVLIGDLSGFSYTNMWEAEGTLYRVPKTTGTPGIFDPANLLARDAEGNWLNIAWGNIQGAFDDVGTHGGFTGSATSWIDGLSSGFGWTAAIASQPDWGIFNAANGLSNFYHKPTGTSSEWSAKIVGWCEMGSYPYKPSSEYAGGSFSDLGRFIMNVGTVSSDWADGLISADIDGTFLTYNKLGSISGRLLGTYSVLEYIEGIENGSWQAVTAGTWDKTAPVYFSSDIQAGLYDLSHVKYGQMSYEDGSQYNYSYEDQGTHRSGWSQFNDHANNVDINNDYEADGLSTNIAYSKETLTHYTASHPTNADKFSFARQTYSNETDYLAALATLENEPRTETPIPSQTAYRLDDDGNNSSGIMGGLGNIWTGSSDVALMLTFNKFDMGHDPFNGIFTTGKAFIFGGEMLSFDPLVDPNPYNKSTTPIGGAYYTFLGGSSDNDPDNTTAGFAFGVYMDQNGNVGVMNSWNGEYFGDLGDPEASPPRVPNYDITGTYYPYIATWDATNTGKLQIYPLAPASYIQNGLNSDNFVSWLETNEYKSVFDDENVVLPDPDPDNLSLTLSTQKLVSAGIREIYLTEFPDGLWGVWQSIMGGSYNNENALTNGSSWSWEIPITPEGQSSVSDTEYISVNVTEPPGNNAFAGDIAGAMVDWQRGGALLIGGKIKGTFDPANTITTWKSIALGTWMEAGNLLDRILKMEMKTEGETEADVTARKIAFEQATKIPCFQVGTANLHGSIGTTSVDQLDVTMNNVTFLASSTGGTPRIWATPHPTQANPSAGVSGYYWGNPVDRPVTLTQQSGISANFTIPANNWNTSTNIWGATVTNGSGTVNGASITFKGGAAGQIVSQPSGPTSPGTFGGTGAGIVTSATPQTPQ